MRRKTHRTLLTVVVVLFIASATALAGQGDGYRIFLDALDRYHTSAFQRDALIGYIMNGHKRLTPQLGGRIEISQALII
jgi:hypothetical protein